MNLKEILDLNENQEKMLYKYMDLLLEWNEKINLTAITDKEDIELKHFIDSISINKYIQNNSKIIDVGTGAGFPGIPLKIYNDTLKITLMDSLNKRLLFLEEVIKELNLKDVETVHGRAEEVGRNTKYREQYDIATSRAVANLSTLMEYMLPLVKVGGLCICMKGPNVQEEIANSKTALSELGGKIEKIDNFLLPKSDIERNIIIIRKIKKISSKYPRRPGTPAKEPI